MEVTLTTLDKRNVTLNAASVVPDGTPCNYIKVHFDAKTSFDKLLSLSVSNAFALFRYRDDHVALLVPVRRLQRIAY
ncbi:hypothetical protein AAE250_12280 [Bacteroides sp. GD17]